MCPEDPYVQLPYFLPEDETQPTGFTVIEDEAESFNKSLNLDAAEAGHYGSYFRGAWERLSRTRKDAGSLYEAVKDLSDDDLDRLHGLLTVLTFGQGCMDELDTGESLFNRVAADLEIDMRDHWRPDEAFLTRRRKDQLEDIAKESGASARIGRMKDYTKKQMVAALAKHFEASRDAGEAAPEHERKGRDWLPGAMLFPAVTADSAPEAEAEEAEAA